VLSAVGGHKGDHAHSSRSQQEEGFELLGDSSQRPESSKGKQDRPRNAMPETERRNHNPPSVGTGRVEQ
jgi:hypothetical protein